jgi:hypothetical protein
MPFGAGQQSPINPKVEHDDTDEQADVCPVLAGAFLLLLLDGTTVAVTVDALKPKRVEIQNNSWLLLNAESSMELTTFSASDQAVLGAIMA